MQDTARDALDQLDLSQTKSKLLAIIANTLVIQAASHAAIQYLGFPFSISEEFSDAYYTKPLLNLCSDFTGNS
jgi:hydroxymethylglutaryl-CoA lyase